MERSELDGARDYFVVFVDHIEDLATLIGVERSVVDQEGLVRSPDGKADAGEQAWKQDLVCVGEHAAQAYGAGLGIDLVIHEVDRSLMRETVLVGEPECHRVAAFAG